MKRYALGLLAAAAAGLATPARAEDGYDRCMEKAVTSQAFSACGTQLVQRREAELNRIWKVINAPLDAATRSALLAEQRLWNAYKDRSCLYWSGGAHGREGQTVHFYTCRAGVIDQRIDYLTSLFEDEAGHG
jgi:uncharacterized protein YecT (DUF1311 family)